VLTGLLNLRKTLVCAAVLGYRKVWDERAVQILFLCSVIACDHGRFKSVCCIPYFIIVILVVLCIIAALIMMAVFGFYPFSHTSNGVSYAIVNGVMIALGAIVGIAVLANVYTWMRAIAHLAVPTRKQVSAKVVNAGDLPIHMEW
jgi:hypothetical protein